MHVIGELINCTRKPIARAVRKHDAERIQEVAVRQVEAGAASLDVNGGIAGHEAEYLVWLVDVIQQAVDVPLCLDSPDLEALSQALPRCRERPMINSITLEPDRLNKLTPLLKEYDARIVALCMEESGYPTSTEDRIRIATSLIKHLTDAGIPPDSIYVDPAVFPVSTNTDAGTAVLDTIEAITQDYPDVHTVCGLSNVSFGLPTRSLLNRTFFTLAMARGLDTVIADPCNMQLMAALAAMEVLLGQDEFCMGYLEAHQNERLEPIEAALAV